MSSPTHITHAGTVVDINHDTIKVKIVAISACVSCTAKQFCGTSDSQDKIIEVPNPIMPSFTVGEEVVVATSFSNAMPAVFFAYVLPAILLMAVLFSAIYLLQSETVAALLTLLFLAVYYGILYLFKNRMSKKFEFAIEKNKKIG